MRLLTKSASSVDDSLQLYRTTNSNWELADSYFYPPPTSLPAVRLRAVHNLPSTFISQYSNVQYRSYMGLFPQINRAWLTVDSNIYLWAYTPLDTYGNILPNSYDFYAYEAIQQVIVCVALVRPKKHVFVNSLEWLLVVATPVHVTLLAVTIINNQLDLIPTNISVSTDNVLMLKITASPEGRIFMAGADGSLHELEYGLKPSSSILNYFAPRPAKRARKVAHNTIAISQYLPNALKSLFSVADQIVDMTLQGPVLFTLSQAASLAVYNVAAEAGPVKPIATVNLRHDLRTSLNAAPNPDREFVSIHAVPPHVSVAVQLIVVTSLGERLYYSTSSSKPSPRHMPPPGHVLKPKTLKFIAYRESPDRHMRANRTCVHMAFCERGSVIMADLKDDQSDKLFCIFPDATLMMLQPSSSSMTSSNFASSPLTVKGKDLVYEKSLGDTDGNAEPEANHLNAMMMTATPRTSRLAQEQHTSPKRTFAIVEAATQPPFDPSMTTSPVQPLTYFWVLTSTSMRLYERTLPTHHLMQLLSGGDATMDFESFFHRYGSVETCSMCLEVAINNPHVASQAAKMFYSNAANASAGGVSKRDDERSHSHDDRHGSRHHREAYDIGRPTAPPTPLATFSGAYEGCSYFMAKTLHPIWTNFITSDRNPNAYQSLSVDVSVFRQVRDQLLGLTAFLDQFPPEAWLPGAATNDENKSRLANTGDDWRRDGRRDYDQRVDRLGPRGSESPQPYRSTYNDKKTNEARLQESSSIASLKQLAVKTTEALALILLMSDHQVHRLVVTMPLESRQQLISMKLRDLIVTEEGLQVASTIIEAMMKGYNNGDAALTSLGGMLKERCPAFFGETDVELHRGRTILRRATEMVAGLPRRPDPRTSSYDPQLGMLDSNTDNSATWKAAMDLAIEAAKIIKGVAGRVFDIVPICNDFRDVGAYSAIVDVFLAVGKAAEAEGQELRTNTAYQAIYDTIMLCLQDSDGMFDGQESLLPHVNDSMRESILQAAFKAESSKFILGLFETLMASERGRDELLNQDHPRLEAFLRDRKASDLLWKYCARHKRFLEAASELQKMAEVTNENLSMVDRLNYLSCAKHNAKAAVQDGVAGASKVFGEISDFIEVAKVQLRLKDELRKRYGTSDETVKAALEELNSEVIDLTSLFNEFARPYELLESILDIFRCGSYRDEHYIKGVWNNIVEREAGSGQPAAALREKIESLGREFYPNENVFPTTVVTDTLERMVYRNQDVGGWRENRDWVVGMMTTIGVPLVDLIEAYWHMLDTASVGDGFTWSEERAQIYLLKVIERVIGLWLKEGDGGSRKALSEAVKAQRAISLCKSRTRGMSSDEAEHLGIRFEELEEKVNPLVQGGTF